MRAVQKSLLSAVVVSIVAGSSAVTSAQPAPAQPPPTLTPYPTAYPPPRPVPPAPVAPAPTAYAPAPVPTAYAPAPAPTAYAPTPPAPAPTAYAPPPAPTAYAPPPAPPPTGYAPVPGPTAYGPPAPRPYAPSPEATQGAPVAPAPPKVDSFESPDIKTDHARAVGHLGIGYMGEFKVPVGSTGATESAQMVGMRWWVQRGWGIDFALGTRLRSGTTSIQGLSRDGARIFAFSASAGVPFPLYSGKHYTFIVEPLVGFGYASRKEKPAATTATAPAASAAETLLRGSRFAFGAVAGAELQLGFIGLPQISIDATVGVSLDVLNGSTRVTTVSGVVTENVDQTIGLDTVSLHQPWDIFHSTVSVIYYL